MRLTGLDVSMAELGPPLPTAKIAAQLKSFKISPCSVLVWIAHTPDRRRRRLAARCYLGDYHLAKQTSFCLTTPAPTYIFPVTHTSPKDVMRCLAPTLGDQPTNRVNTAKVFIPISSLALVDPDNVQRSVNGDHPKVNCLITCRLATFPLLFTLLCQLKHTLALISSNRPYCAVPKFGLMYPVSLVLRVVACPPARISLSCGLCDGSRPPRDTNSFCRISRDS